MLRTVQGMNSEVTVVLRERREGPRGREELVETGRVSLWARIQQSRTEDIEALAAAGETQVLNIRRLYCRAFPGDDLSQVIDAEGVLYNVVGEPKRHRGSRRTARDVVTLRQAGVKRGERTVI